VRGPQRALDLFRRAGSRGAGLIDPEARRRRNRRFKRWERPAL